MNLKIMRIRAGLRQYELAAKLGISPSRLSGIECGRVESSPELVVRIQETIRKARSAKPQ
jgi:transcriptional regulator with XRE-family HTH domain